MSSKTKLFVHGFVPEMDEEQRFSIVLANFSKYGNVTREDITLIKDHTYGGWRNFCFVEMEPEEAKAAMEALNDFAAPEGITFSISVAKPKTDSPDRDARPRTGGYNKSGGSSYGGGNGGGYGSNNSYGKSGGYGSNNGNSNNNW